MTLPSSVVMAIAQVLSDTLKGTEAKPRDLPLIKEVKVWDGEFGKEGTNFLSIGDPGVLVACTGMQLVEDGGFPKTADCVFVAYVVTKVKAIDNRSRGLVGADLAGIVAAVVDGNTWTLTDDAGVSTTFAIKIPTRIRVQNEHTEELAQKGASVWSVFWTQRIELTWDVAAELHRLGSIHFTFAMSADTAVPREMAEVDFPEPTP